MCSDPCVPIPYKYSPAIREEAIDLALSHSVAHASRVTKVTYPTVTKWLTEFQLVCSEINNILANKS